MPATSSSANTGTPLPSTAWSAAMASTMRSFAASGSWPKRSRAAHLDLGDGGALVAFDDDEIARIEPGQHLGQLGLGAALQLGDHRPAVARDNRHLRGAGATVTRAVGLGVIDLEGMVGVLDGRDLQAALASAR